MRVEAELPGTSRRDGGDDVGGRRRVSARVRFGSRRCDARARFRERALHALSVGAHARLREHDPRVRVRVGARGEASHGLVASRRSGFGPVASRSGTERGHERDELGELDRSRAVAVDARDLRDALRVRRVDAERGERHAQLVRVDGAVVVLVNHRETQREVRTRFPAQRGAFRLAALTEPVGRRGLIPEPHGPAAARATGERVRTHGVMPDCGERR